MSVIQFKSQLTYTIQEQSIMTKAKNGNGKSDPVIGTGQEFTARNCLFGGSQNGRTENHGDDLIPADDFQISGFMLPADDLNKFLNDVHTHQSWFDTKGNLKVPTAWFADLKMPLRLTMKFEYCRIAMLLGTDENETVLAPVNIASITLEPVKSGFTEMCFQIQTTTDDDELIARLRHFRGREIKLGVRLGNREGDKPKVAADKNQGELQMDHKADSGAGAAATH
jgi:hypothetical protein